MLFLLVNVEGWGPAITGDDKGEVIRVVGRKVPIWERFLKRRIICNSGFKCGDQMRNIVAFPAQDHGMLLLIHNLFEFSFLTFAVLLNRRRCIIIEIDRSFIDIDDTCKRRNGFNGAKRSTTIFR